MEDILDDEKLNSVSLADQALYLRLLAVLNRQKSRDGNGVLDSFAACALAKRERWAYARPAYDRLHAGGLVRVIYRDGGLAYFVRNWAKLQGFATAKLRRDSAQTPAPTPTPTPTPTTKKERRAPRSSTIPGWALECADLLIEFVREAPGGQIPNKARISWAQEIEKLVKITPELRDNGSDQTENIKAAIRWVFGPENQNAGKYRLVVLSGKALREKWPRIRDAARRSDANRAPSREEMTENLLKEIERG